MVEVLTLENGIYIEFCKARKTGAIRSKVIDGLARDLTEIFEVEGAKRIDSKN